MDIKMGVRTYLEDELAKAREKPKLRKVRWRVGSGGVCRGSRECRGCGEFGEWRVWGV